MLFRSVAQVEFNSTLANDARISVGNTAGIVNQWVFDNTGNLTLPDNTSQILYANGTSILSGLGGGNANTGTVTFVDNVIEGDSSYVLGLSPHPTFTDGTYTAAPGPELGPQYLRVRGGDNYEHIHFDTSNNSAFDLYVGDDNKYFKLSKDGPAVIGANGPTWAFGTDGVLTFPTGGNVVFDSSALSVIDGVTSITATGNISANNFIGGGANVDIVAGSYAWNFDNNGIFVVPGEGVIRSLDDTVTLQSFNTASGFANGVYVGTSGGLGFADASIGSNWLEIFKIGRAHV